MRKWILRMLLLASSLLLIACEVPAPGTPLPTITPPPTATVPPTYTVEPSVTVAPTDTVEPTSTTVPDETAIVPIASPTDTPVPPTVAPTATVEPNVGPFWPERPAFIGDYVMTILDYLNEDPVHIIRLRSMLRDWGAISDRIGQVEEADLDGDGQLEWIVVFGQSAQGAITVPGDLIVIDQLDGDYVLLFQDSVWYGDLQENVALLSTGDINADGLAELAYTTMTCGAHTCFSTVYLFAWDGTAFASLIKDDILMPYAEIALENLDGDPAQELTLHGGMIGSVGAGPQRSRTEIYDWNGSIYTLKETVYDPSDFLYFKVLDANTALRAGDYTRGIALYNEVISDGDLRTWKGPAEREDLVAFARYRLALIYLLVKDEANAEAMAQALQAEQPYHIYNQVTQVLLDYYYKEGSVLAACQAITEFAAEFPETTEVLNGFGYANPAFTPEEVCPIGVISTP